ncbi:sugar phosphate isomerase/epimerase family protein [Pareuzebyella sediminis]|uniref:sugar phosphate isomerase/epimerase family protein n=1 Tax=Pareuzebyella sediminis TaxID=2607998 RepID=UPI0018E0FB2E|nr:sugar phosphate isomerase/epimerase family protein [Pareuzebyella sediminis]
MNRKMSRRNALKSTMALAGLTYLENWNILSSTTKSKVKIGACDWSIGKMADVAAIPLAKKIGLDGVQISLGTLDNNMHLRQKNIQQQYQHAFAKYGITMGGIAIGEMNNIPYKSDARAEKWVSDSIDVAKAMNCKVVLLAFFYNGDLKNDIEGTKETIKRLKKVAPKAEDHGIILGIESWLSAQEHMEILDAVNSPNVKVYYDVANSNKMGYDIYQEIQALGKEHICEFHAKENGFLLGQGRIDFQRFGKILHNIGYEGWVQIEGAVPENGDMFKSYVHNNTFIRSALEV